jgi:hypothetical protein
MQRDVTAFSPGKVNPIERGQRVHGELRTAAG